MPVESNVEDSMVTIDDDAVTTAGKTLKEAVPELN